MKQEVLDLLRTCEEFGVKVGTLQHILEGYKVADEIAAHGAGASAFSDWWAYKFEVYDAIPYNGALMRERGVLVSFNSDSDELARRMNVEAAKAVKYGGVPRAEALKFLTLNPAKQLKLDKRIGSLEPGKDGDFAIWSGDPLDPTSRCDETWIEGRRYFDRAADLAGRAALAAEKADLVGKSRLAAARGSATSPAEPARRPARHSCDEESGDSEDGRDGGDAVNVLLLASVLVLKGATVHTAAGPAIANGVVVISDGRILSVGGPETSVPAGAEVVDVSGKHVAPAFFAPASLVGLVEIPAVRATNDFAEVGEINPEARPDAAMNLDSETLPVTRSGGVLFAALAPRGSTFPGAASVVTLNGWTREDACVKCPAAVLVEWPVMSIDRRPDARPAARVQERRRDEALELIRTTFRDAAAFRTAKAAEGKAGVPGHDDVAPLSALRAVLDGSIPLVIRAERKTQIDAALRFLDEELKGEKVRAVILGGADAPKVAATLAARKIPVILDAVLELPLREDDAYDAPFTRAAELTKAGVVVAIGNGQSGMSAATTRDLPNHAAMAAAFGLSRLDALRAITLNPAKIFGVDDRIGSLEEGKDASLAVFTGDPLLTESVVVALYDKGVRLDLSDRHKRLWERYRNRPKKQPSGR